MMVMRVLAVLSKQICDKDRKKKNGLTRDYLDTVKKMP